MRDPLKPTRVVCLGENSRWTPEQLQEMADSAQQADPSVNWVFVSGVYVAEFKGPLS